MEWLPLDMVDPLTDKLHYRYTSRIESCGYFDADGDLIGSRSEIRVVVRLEVFREIRKPQKVLGLKFRSMAKSLYLITGEKDMLGQRRNWPGNPLLQESKNR